MLGDVAVRAQAQGGAVKQADRQSAPPGLGIKSHCALSLQLEGLEEKSQRQALAGIAVGGRCDGAEFFGQPRAQGVGPSAARIAEDFVERVVALEALKNQIPEGNDGTEEPLIEPFS